MSIENDVSVVENPLLQGSRSHTATFLSPSSTETFRFTRPLRRGVAAGVHLGGDTRRFISRSVAEGYTRPEDRFGLVSVPGNFWEPWSAAGHEFYVARSPGNKPANAPGGPSAVSLVPRSRLAASPAPLTPKGGWFARGGVWRAWSSTWCTCARTGPRCTFRRTFLGNVDDIPQN